MKALAIRRVLLKIPILTAVIFILTAQLPVLATDYYFSTSGNDANSGLNSTLPKKNITAALPLMLSGNKIFFKRGDSWYIPGRTINLTGISNLTLGAYGSGNKPVIAGMALFNGTWTHQGSGVWKYTDTFTVAHRVFVGGVSRINLLYKVGNNDVLSDLDQTDEFFFSAGSLYLKTTSTTTPPANVEIVPGRPGAWGGYEVISIKNSNNITVNNIEFRGGSVAQVIYVEAPCRKIVFDNCIIGRASRNGLTAINPAANANYIDTMEVTNCVVDKGWTIAENNIKASFTLGGKTYDHALEGDGIAFVDGVRYGLIRGNVVTNWGHDGIVLSAFGSTAIYGVKFVKVESNDVSAGNSGYMHAFSLNGIADKLVANIIKRNYFHDFNSGCNVTGDMNFIFSNIFSNVTMSTIPQHSQSPWALNMATWPIDIATGTVNTVARNNFIANNSFYRTNAYALLMDKFVGDSATLSGNKIYNNIMMRFGVDTMYNYGPGETTPPSVGVRLIVSVKPNSNYFSNNNFWPNCDAVLCDTSNTKYIVQYGGASYTIANFNGCGNCGPGKSSGNVQLNPRFDAFFGLTPYSSATLRSGGYNYKTNIIGWGLPAGEFVDYFGTPWPDTGPSIGAVQYTTP